VSNFLSEGEIAEICCGLVRVQASDCGKRIVIEHSSNLAAGGVRIGIGDDVQQPAFRAPALGENAIEGAQRKMSYRVEVQGLPGSQVSGDAHRVPADVHGLVYKR